jgi:predicted DNA-binding WGR domain protein
MNRTRANDSELSLDVRGTIGESVGMISQPYQLYVERSDTLRNMARYYAMDISVTLFGQACLTRRWGRIGSRGQSKCHTFEDEEEAVSLFLNILRQKRGRGYRPATRRNEV